MNRAELALDEAGQRHPFGARGGLGGEAFQVFMDNPVQGRVGGRARASAARARD
jgi:hypothetical protein